MKLKKTVMMFFTALFVQAVSNVFAMPVDISVNKNYIKTDTEPVIENGHVLAPLRAVANALGCDEVFWEDELKKVTLKKNDVSIEISAGENTAYVDGEVVKLDTAAKIVNDRIMIPIRFVGENFDADILWNEKTYTVEIKKNGHEVEDKYINKSYTEEDLHWLARIVHAESRGESSEGKTGVANVVINRVKSDDFPNTVYEVIFDTKYGVQFTPVANGTVYNEAGKASYEAAKKALRGENTVGDSLYFCNPVISTNFWIMNNRTFYKTIGGHDFYL